MHRRGRRPRDRAAGQIRLDRDDDFLVTGCRHGFDFDWDVGFDDDGRIVAAEIDMISNAAHCADLSAPVMTPALCHFDNAYWLPEVAMHGYSARTDTQSNTAFRGFGGPRGAIAIEVIVAAVARRLGGDPLDVRRANFYGIGERDVTPYAQRVDDNIIAPLGRAGRMRSGAGTGRQPLSRADPPARPRPADCRSDPAA